MFLRKADLMMEKAKETLRSMSTAHGKQIEE